MKQHRLSLGQRKRVVELYIETENNSVSIAAKYSISATTVCNILRNSINKIQYKVLKSKKMSEAMKRIYR